MAKRISTTRDDCPDECPGRRNWLLCSTSRPSILGDNVWLAAYYIANSASDERGPKRLFYCGHPYDSNSEFDLTDTPQDQDDLLFGLTRGNIARVNSASAFDSCGGTTRPAQIRLRISMPTMTWPELPSCASVRTPEMATI